MAPQRPSQDDPFIGSRIREYEILGVLGRGGMGAVYRARHVYLEEERAIKVIKSDKAADRSLVDRFIREARLLGRLRSPHLVQLFEFGTLGEHEFFMVMELLQGESALDRIRARGRIEVDEAVRIVREAALGLQEAHQKGVVHRDISPDNLLLVKGDDGREITKVIDFGIAKPLFDTVRSETATNVFLGKLEYSSPEQCGMLSAGETIDGRADIYSLGVTLYHMLAGRLPFQSPTAHGYLLKHATEEPPAPSQFVPAGALPAGLEAVLLKALAKDRRKRQQSMLELVKELTSLHATRAAAPPSDHLAEGTTFAGRYRIEARLGSGGMGVVYRAVDTFLGVPVALKVIRRDVASEGSILDRLKREVILARKVAHPNVCRIHDFGESSGTPYVSMELLEGRSLADILGGSRVLALGAGLAIVRQILSALGEAHRAGVVHRDLKPANVLVEKSGRAYIMDFGISTSADVTRLTQAGAVMGTPHYMAPEQVLAREVDGRADLYAVGIIMYRMFTGALPFDANTPIGVLMDHVRSPPPPPSLRMPGLPAQLEKVILAALAKNPAERFKDAAEMASALDAIEASAGETAALFAPPGAFGAEEPQAPPEPTRTDQMATLLEEARARLDRGELTEVERLLQQATVSAPGSLVVQLLGKELEAAREARRQAQERRREEEEQVARRAAQAVSEARRLFVRGKADDALAALEAFQPEHPLVTEALAELRAEREALEQARQREEEARRAAEAARREEEERRQRELEELARRVEQRVAGARERFSKGDHAGALAFLEGFRPEHELVKAALRELRKEKEALEQARQREEEARRAAEAARREEEERRQRELEELARRVEQRVAGAREMFSKGDHAGALAFLEGFRPEHELVKAALRELRKEKEALEQTRQREEEARRAAEAARREEEERRRRELEELARRAEQRVAGARERFSKGDHAGALAFLEGFRPEHELVKAALRELRKEKEALEQARQREEEARRTAEAARRAEEERRRRELEELARRAEQRVAGARERFSKGDHAGALAFLEGFRPEHELVRAALRELRKEKEALEQARQREKEARRAAEAARRAAPAQLLEPVPVTPEAVAPQRGRRWLGVVAAAGLVVVVLGGLLVARLRAPREEPESSPRPTVPAQTPVMAPVVVPVSLNALPWARVRLKPLTPGVDLGPITDEERTTPCYLRLPEGDYLVEMDNGGVSQSRSERIQVRKGASNVFSFPLVGYNPEARVSAVMGEP